MSAPADFADLATIGPVFALSPLDDDPDWRPVAELVGDAALLRGHVERARGLFGTVEDRVAASWVLTAIAARLVAPTLALAAVDDRLLPVAALRWRPWTGGLLPLGAPPVPTARGVDPDTLADALLDPISTLTTTLRACSRVSARLLQGEVAAAVAKVAVIVARERPEAATTVDALATNLLGRAPHAGLASVAAGAVVRRTCCLAYRVPGGHTCADCVLGPARAGADLLTPPSTRSVP